MSENEIFDTYLRGELPEQDAKKFEQQLAIDSALADRFETHSRLSEELKAVQPVESPDLRNKVKKRIRRRSGGKFFAGAGLKALLGSASLIALLIGLVLFLLMGPFGLLGEQQLSSDGTESTSSEQTTTPDPVDTETERTPERRHPQQTRADEEAGVEEFERALQDVRRGGGLATPGRVSGQGAGATARMYVLAYKITFTKSREDVGGELRLMLPDDDVIETDEGFEFSMSKSEVAPMLSRLSEFDAEIEDFRREVPHTERNVAFFRVVLQ